MTASGPADDSATPTDPGDPAGRKRLWWWLAVAGAIAVLAIIGILVAMAVAGQSPQPGQTSPGHPSDSPSASAGPGESGDPDDPEVTDSPDPDTTIDPDFGEPVADTAVGDETANFGDSVTAKLAELEFITVTGTRAGEVSGPAIRVTVEMMNGTDGAISLDAVTVNAYFGAETQPASPFDSETESEPFTGTLAAGETAQGVYLFSIPEGQDDDIVVTVSKSPESPLVVFRR